MKHKILKKAIISAGVALCAFSLGISAFAADSKGEKTVVSASAKVTDPVLYVKDGFSIIYEDKNFSIGVRELGLPEVLELEELGEPVLISRNEYVDGDYRFVDEIYCQTGNYSSRSPKNDFYSGIHEVYYEPDLPDGKSMHLATMQIDAFVCTDADQDYASVYPDSIKCTTNKIGSDTYPIITEGDHTHKDCFSLGSGLPRFAIVTYPVIIEKADGVRDRHVMMFFVSSDGRTDVHCEHYAV
ncbi:MAG: hypothetical protein K2N56_09465 [Oscillospiraceae bacterium]|nr:hypothetical protein [Oscillospiraceae bacterium]